MYVINSQVRLHDTDAAGILFFGNYFKMAHDVYEEFMKSIGFGLQYIIKETEFLVLISHAEADYKKPLQLEEKLTINLTVESIGQTSFVLSYLLKDTQSNIAATVKTVHVTVDKKSGGKIHLPDKLRVKLESFK